ncbi:sporulation protein Cse60 [Amedibacillus sp. YH-ame10]
MLAVKVFDEEHEDDLSDAINEFLRDNEDINVLDIKFSSAICEGEEEQTYCFSAMLIYSS